MAQDVVKPRKPVEKIDVLPPVKNLIFDAKRNVEYQIGNCIGEGGFAKCYEARRVDTGEIFCCKTLWKAKLRRDADKMRARTEVAIHRKMKHAAVVRFYSAFEDDDYLYLFMEMCRRGTLKDLILRRKTLTEPEVRYYALQLLSAIEYFMQSSVIHRDLKLANVFIMDDMTLRIGDFGLAGRLEPGQDRKKTRCGTPNYTAPEVLDKDGHSYEVDMWALGVIIYTLLIGVPPFQTKGGLEQIYYKIKAVDMNFPPESKISSEARDVITLILQANPADRPDFLQVRRHPFFLGFTPSSLSRDTLRHPPQFPAAATAPKRILDNDGFARPSLIPPTTPHKKAKFGASPRAISPAPLPKPSAPFEPVVAEDENNAPAPPPQPHPIERPAASRGYVFEEICKVFNTITKMASSGYTCAEIESQIGEADLSVPNFLSKWVSQGAKRRFVYEFIDGTTGVLFEDLSTLTMSPDHQLFEQIKCLGNQPAANRYSRAAFQQLDSARLALFDRFVQELKTIPPALIEAAKHTALPSALRSPAPLPLDNSARPLLSYITKVSNSKYATIIRLSDESVQMNLTEDHKFLLTDKGRCIVVIPKKGTVVQTYSMLDIHMRFMRASKNGGVVEPSLHALYNRLQYFLDLIKQVVSRSRERKAAPPQKAPLSNQV